MLKKFNENLEAIPLILLTVVMTVLIFVQVIMRYVLHRAL